MNREVLIERIRALRPVLAENGVIHVALYGSRARGDHRPDSDVDLLIDVDDGRKFSLVEFAQVEDRLSREIGLPISLVMRRSLVSSFAQEIAGDTLGVF